jgi:ABC-type nitrate/sulfonate/bicarbonate transport system permease component
LYDPAARPFPAIQRVGELLVSHEPWHDILISLAEIGGGIIFGGLIALAVSTVMNRSGEIQHAIANISPVTYLSPIVLWLLVFQFVLPFDASMNWYRSFFLSVGHKMMGVGLVTFFPLLQTMWAFRDTPVPTRLLIAIDDALPMAFIAMCFGELYAATAGLGFQMVVESATFKFQESLAWFLITVISLSALSMFLRLMVKLSGVQAGQTQASDAR